MIIGISGESGVGKSTIARIISLYYDAKNTAIISTDDLHKWERLNPAWEHITHLNPDANNLELGDIHLTDLSQGKYIYRSVYNHKTGYFDPPKKIEPLPVIVVEGLHAFYTELSKNLIDIKIYIDTNEELKTHWKLIRDTEERGYKYNMVLEAINKRKPDALKIRNAQINVSDVIISVNPTNKIKVLGDRHEKIDLSISISYKDRVSQWQELFSFIEEYLATLKKYIQLSESVGEDIELCQDMGGNASIKMSHNLMFIKPSGTALKDARLANNVSIVDYTKIDQLSQNDKELELSLKNSLVLHKRPSMETGFHALLDKYVLHAHPIYLTLILCLESSQDIINNLYSNSDFRYIKYANPGYQLFHSIQSVNNVSKIFFLENHGVILSSDDGDWCTKSILELNDKAKNYIKTRCDFKYFDLSFAENIPKSNYAFPDAFILSDNEDRIETRAAHNYISIIGSQIGKLRYLSSDDINFLRNMESEKYRKSQ